MKSTVKYSRLICTLLIALLFIINVHSVGITAADTHISTNRNHNRASICAYYSANYSASDIASSQKYIDQYNYMTSA